MDMHDRRADQRADQRADDKPDRSALMEQHVAARARRDKAALGSDEFRAAADEIARIEIAIAAMEEPPPTTTASS